MISDERRAEARALNGRIRQYDAVQSFSTSRMPNTVGQLLSSFVLLLDSARPDLVVASVKGEDLTVDVIHRGLWLSSRVTLSGQDSSVAVPVRVRPLRAARELEVSADVSVFDQDAFSTDWPGSVAFSVHFAGDVVLHVPQFKPADEEAGAVRVLEALTDLLAEPSTGV